MRLNANESIQIGGFEFPLSVCRGFMEDRMVAFGMDVCGSKVSGGNEIDHNLRSALGDVVPLFPERSNLVFRQSLGVHRRNGWSDSTDSDENDATNSVDLVVSGPVQIERALKLGSTPVDLRSTSQEEPLSGERVYDRDLRRRVLPQVANGSRGADVGPDHLSLIHI